jgi:hypothetical protein
MSFGGHPATYPNDADDDGNDRWRRPVQADNGLMGCYRSFKKLARTEMMR